MRNSKLPYINPNQITLDELIELEKLKNLTNMIQRMQTNCVERIKSVEKQINRNHAKAKEL